MRSMIDYKPITIEDKTVFAPYLSNVAKLGCGYSFANLLMWGLQKAAILHDHIIFFAQFDSEALYPYPAGSGDKKKVLDAIINDSKERGIACCLSRLGENEKLMLETLYPCRFRFECDPNSSDYVYDINDLADLKGRKYHRKRNHFKHFCTEHPEYTTEALNEDNLSRAVQMIDDWYADKLQENPDGDYQAEQKAISKALRYYRELELEGMILLDGEDILAVTIGSQIDDETFDVHFEKARSDVDGAYTAINCEFAKHIRDKYPQIRFLNREEDLGIEGLRKAKMSYYPHHMVEKYNAYLLEDGCEN